MSSGDFMVPNKNKKQNNNVDKLVICFSKSLNMDIGKLPSIGLHQLGDPWISLGYFDSIQICSLGSVKNNSEWLDAVRKSSIELSDCLQGQYYIHPLYIIEDLSSNENREEYESFWDKNSNYIFISLIQFKLLGNGRRDVNSIDTLKEQIDRIRDCSISFVSYHTLELSDLVVIWKADSIVTMLVTLWNLFRCGAVSDINTFCGISKDAIIKSQRPEQNASTTDDPEVPYINMHLLANGPQDSIKALEYLHAQKDSFGGYSVKHFFVTGIDDFHIVWSGLTEQKFLYMLKECFFTAKVAA